MANKAPIPYAELHAHTNFSFLDGASPPDELVARAVELGLAGLAATDHDGLYGSVRFTAAAEEAGLHPVIGTEIGARAPPDGYTLTMGVSSAAISRRLYAIASEMPRSSDSTPGYAAGVSMNATTGRLNFSASFIALSALR